MAGKTVQFSKFDTTYHDYYRPPSSSPDAISSHLSVALEQSSPRHSPDAHGVTLSELPPVPAIDRTPRIYPGTPSLGSTPRSFSSETFPPHYSPTIQSRALSPPMPTIGLTYPSNLSIHKVLRHGLIPPINYNLRFSDESAIRACPELTPSVLAEAASTPPVSSIVVTCDRLPWHITITPNLKSKKRNSVVTVADVLHKLYRELRQGLAISDEQFGRLPHETQVMLWNAFEARCQLLPEGVEQYKERGKGLKCIDYLNMNTRFQGFVRIGEDNERVHWKLEVASPYQRSASIVEESASDTSW
jgi:hypothetical protein